jgi:hypothetical protein
LRSPVHLSQGWAGRSRSTLGGRANLAEYKADGPAGHVELLSLRYYNPNAHQWGLLFATPNVGKLSVPCIGEFKNGRGDFYDQEEFNGQYILVRFSIWKINENEAQSEQAFSNDGGKTWELNWVNTYTRANAQSNIDWSEPASNRAEPGAHDFDFSFGTWHTHIERILDPFADQHISFEMDGSKTVTKVWGGKATLEEIEADGPKGHWEGLTLFLFDPKSRQWTQTFINSKVGVVAAALVGGFKNGKGDLYQQDTFEDRSIWVRGVWSDITPNSHNYTESYSDDGGETWKPAFIAHLTRVQQE